MVRPWVYIASAYTKGDIGANVRFQMTVWDVLFELGCVPIAPLWSHFQHVHSPRKYEDWVAYDNEIITRCDVLLRLAATERIGDSLYVQQESPGADAEVALAISLGKPVVYSILELEAYMGKVEGAR